MKYSVALQLTYTFFYKQWQFKKKNTKVLQWLLKLNNRTSRKVEHFDQLFFLRNMVQMNVFWGF